MIVLTSSGQFTEPKECTVFRTKHNNSNLEGWVCSFWDEFSDNTNVWNLGYPYRGMFSAQLSAWSCIICARGVIRNLMVAAVSKPSIVVAFASIFMAKVETEILNQSALKLLVWKKIYWGHLLPLEHNQRRDHKHHQLKYPRHKQTSWTLLFTKAKDLKLSRC